MSAAELTVRWAPADGRDAAGAAGAAVGATFSWSPGTRVLTHRLALSEVDNDLGDRIAAELVRPGLIDDFEAAFAGVVQSTAADPRHPLDAWQRFYEQTLRGLVDPARRGNGAIATFGSIYRHALELVVGDSLLDAGSCFGFFCLVAAASRPGLAVTGTDLSAPTVALATRIASRIVGDEGGWRTSRRSIDRPGAPGAVGARGRVDFTVADVRAGLPGRADTVTALHVLEHLAPSELEPALRTLCAAARRLVIVAVPLEPTPDPTYGHRTAFPDLQALLDAAAPVTSRGGWRDEVHERRGGWLVLTREP